MRAGGSRVIAGAREYSHLPPGGSSRPGQTWRGWRAFSRRKAHPREKVRCTRETSGHEETLAARGGHPMHRRTPMDRSAVVRFGRARRHPEQIGSTARLNCRPVRAREAARRNTGPGIRDRPVVRFGRARRHPEQIGSTARLNCRPVRAREAAPCTGGFPRVHRAAGSGHPTPQLSAALVVPA